MMEQKINWQPDHLKNEVVLLVPLTEQDFDPLYQVASDPLIWEQHPSSDRYQKNVFQEFFNTALASKAAFVIVDKHMGQIIGSTRFYDYNASDNSIAIGFTFLARKYWGGKYNLAVKELMLHYAFGYAGKVIFHIGATNIRSQIATSRLGAIKTMEFFTQTPTGKRLSYEYTLYKDNREKNQR